MHIQRERVSVSMLFIKPLTFKSPHLGFTLLSFSLSFFRSFVLSFCLSILLASFRCCVLIFGVLFPCRLFSCEGEDAISVPVSSAKSIAADAYAKPTHRMALHELHLSRDDGGETRIACCQPANVADVVVHPPPFEASR